MGRGGVKRASCRTLGESVAHGPWEVGVRINADVPTDRWRRKWERVDGIGAGSMGAEASVTGVLHKAGAERVGQQDVGRLQPRDAVTMAPMSAAVRSWWSP